MPCNAHAEKLLIGCPKRRCAPSAMSRRRPASSTATATSRMACAGAAAPARPPQGLRAAWPAPRLKRQLCLLSPLRPAPQQRRASRGARLGENMRRYAAHLCCSSMTIISIRGRCLQLQLAPAARPRSRPRRPLRPAQQQQRAGRGRSLTESVRSYAARLCRKLSRALQCVGWEALQHCFMEQSLVNSLWHSNTLVRTAKFAGCCRGRSCQPK
jgi:hypothetical protein